KAKLESEVQKVEDALKTNNIDTIKAATENLSKAWNELSQQLYQQQGPQGGAQPGPDVNAEQQGGQQQQSTSQEQKKDDREVQDASYKVVDDK
ncbi:MAG: molecular chaperone DnaK, partial [Ignavibacteria bacterium]|nr:molecular chaperone DnaK [Ignavibacteria bacterium]